MNTDKKTARTVGIFYIAATVAGILGISLTQTTLDAAEYLSEVAANENQMLAGALLELVMAVAVACIGFSVYPVLKKRQASIAIGYVGARLVEGVLLIISTLSMLTLLTLSREFVDNGTPGASYYHTVGELLLAVREWGGHVVLDVAVFPLGALMLYCVFYQARLVPRWLAGWGLIGAILYWSASILVMFDVIEPLASAHIALQAPVGLQEMVFALWLIIKGFNLPVQTTPNDG